MFGLETLGPCILIDVTLSCTNYLDIIADHISPSRAAVLPDDNHLTPNSVVMLVLFGIWFYNLFICSHIVWFKSCNAHNKFFLFFFFVFIGYIRSFFDEEGNLYTIRLCWEDSHNALYYLLHCYQFMLNDQW